MRNSRNSKNQLEVIRTDWELNPVQKTVVEATETVIQRQPEKDWTKDLLVGKVADQIRRWTDQTASITTIEETLSVLDWE